MKTVVISGGAGGIGSAIVRRFTREGYRVILGYHKSLEKAK